MKYNSFFILLVFLLLSENGFADNYPKNLDIDILDYTFQLTLSDETDEIVGQAKLTIEIKKDNQEKIRLDLINKSVELEGKGMVVAKVFFSS